MRRAKAIRTDIYKRVIAITLSVMALIHATMPIVMGLSLGSQLGTRAALGSPLIDANFSSDDYQKWEMQVFGIFLSNFVQPFVDDYVSAFSEGKGGSEGKGRKALQFAGGNDAQANKALQQMLNFAINAQTTMKSIDVRYTVYDGRSGGRPTKTESIESRPATVKDLLIVFGDFQDDGDMQGATASQVQNNETQSELVAPTHQPTITLSRQDWYRDTNYGVYSEKLYSATLPTFYIRGNASGADVVVYDFNNPWDLQAYALWATDGFAGGNDGLAKLVEETIKKVMRSPEDYKLNLDTFGNITTTVDGRNVVLIPAASNQHLTTSPIINMLNSTILNGRYTDDIERTLKMDPSKKGDDNRAELLLAYDIESDLFEHIFSGVGGQFDAGKAFAKLADANMGNKRGNLKAFVDSVYWKTWFGRSAGGTDNAAYYGENAVCASLYMSNILDTVSNYKIIDYMHTKVSATDPIFGQPVYVASDLDGDVNNIVNSVVNVAGKLMDGSYRVDTGGSAELTGAAIKNELASGAAAPAAESNVDYSTALIDYLMSGSKNSDGNFGNNYPGVLAQHALSNSAEISLNDDAKQSELQTTQLKDLHGKVSEGVKIKADGASKVLKVFQRNTVMRDAERVMTLAEGTEFAAWTPWIYITYLEVYGVKGSESKLSTNIFPSNLDALNIKPEEMFGGIYMTEEEKEKEVNNNIFLMLSPSDAGKKYRGNLLWGWVSDFLHRTYIGMVYGDCAYDYAGGVGSQTSGGFLKFDNYEDNFLTGWLIAIYVDAAAIIIGICVIGTLILAIIFHRGIIWTIANMAMTIVIVVITPSIGDAVPTLANNVIQEIFRENTDAWALSESIANQRTEEQYLESLASGDQTGDVYELSVYTDFLSTLTLERTLMIKQDISKKVVADPTGIMNVVQQNASTRWLLPRLMVQMSADEGSYDYVSVPLGTLYDNWSSLYWLYNPWDKNNVNTINASESNGTSVECMPASSKKQMFEGYVDTKIGDDHVANGSNKLAPHVLGMMKKDETSPGTEEDIGYGAYVSEYAREKVEIESWQSLSRGNKEITTVPGHANSIPSHTQFYMLPADYGVTVPAREGKSWETYTEEKSDKSKHPNLGKAMEASAIKLQDEANNYDERNTGATAGLGFLWATENPGHYFYQVVKDTYAKNGANFAELIGDLQGDYEAHEKGKDEVRVSSLHMSKSGAVRDILDLEELFTNVIPYLQSINCIACGTDGENGILGDMKLTRYPVYEDNAASWLFRSNWVTKLVDNYCAPYDVMAGDGKSKVTVDDQMDPRQYPGLAKGRPMIFSEAQMVAFGLGKSNLTPIELKCVELNETVAKEWTLMLNYTNTDGINLEIMLRHMALKALLEFNKEFTPAGLSMGSKAMYPTYVDLRNLSFDSVLRMLVISNTNGADYAHGDVMKAFLNKSDTISSLLLLVATFMCQKVAPLCRNILSALVFYLGIWCILRNLLSVDKKKLKLCGAVAVSNLIFLAMTVAYYWVFAIMISIKSPDEVLSTGGIKMAPGSVAIVMIIILCASVAYVFGAYKLARFLIAHNSDMGLSYYETKYTEISSAVASRWNTVKVAANSIKESAKSIGSGIRGSYAGGDTASVSPEAGTDSRHGGSGSEFGLGDTKSSGKQPEVDAGSWRYRLGAFMGDKLSEDVVEANKSRKKKNEIDEATDEGRKKREEATDEGRKKREEAAAGGNEGTDISTDLAERAVNNAGGGTAVYDDDDE